MTTAAPVLLAASPREGNTLEAARLFCAGFNRRGKSPSPMDLLLLRDYRVSPCTACGACDHAGASCPQAGEDDSPALFARLAAAPLLVVASPVYFYHLPARLKALLDRCQYYHRAAERGEALLPRRRFLAVLLGAREKGGELFRGSLLSLKWALAPLGFEPATPLLLRGLDGPRDLEQREGLRARITAWGEAAAENVLC